MKIYIDRDKVNSRATLANAASVGGLLVLLASVLAPLFVEILAPLELVLLFVGGATAMIGIYLANRWVRKPRPEDSLDGGLKAFDEGYRLYHYPSAPAEHILLSPSGITLMEVVNLPGRFTHHGGRWKESMTMGRALRYLVEPRVVDPVELAEGLAEDMRNWLEQRLPARSQVPIRVVTVFTHPGVELECDRGSIPAVKVARLRKQLSAQGGRLSPAEYEALAASLEHATLP